MSSPVNSYLINSFSGTHTSHSSEVPISSGSHLRDVSTTSANNARSLDASPRVVACSGRTLIREMPPKSQILRVYKPTDFAKEVDRIGGSNITRASSPGQFRQIFPEVAKVEEYRIALQTALFNIFLDSPKTKIEDLNIKNIAIDSEIFNDMARIKEFVNHSSFKLDSKTGRYTSKSGLKVTPAKSWNVMSLDKHLLMRASPIYKLTFDGVTIEGKIYADYLDHSNNASRDVLKEAARSNEELSDMTASMCSLDDEPDDDTHAMRFHSQKHLFEHALNTLVNKAITDHLATINPSVSPAPRIRPSIVEWADDVASEKYIAAVRFNNEGGMELELPQVTVDQFEGKIPTGDLNDNGKQHLLVFVQDLEGNIKTTRHKDTHFHHSTPNGGRPVRTAGEFYGKFRIENENQPNQKVIFQVDKICNKSGHYWPKIETLGHFRDDLIASGLKINKVTYKAETKDEHLLDAVADWSSHSAPSYVPPQSQTSKHLKDLVSKIQNQLCEPKEEWVV